MRFEKKEDGTDNSWMDTYGDMVTLLLCFFILLAAISKIDTVLFEQVQSGMTKEIGHREPERPIEVIKQQAMEAVKANQVEDAVNVGTDDMGVTIDLASASFFTPGSAEILDEAKPVLLELAGILGVRRFRNYIIEVQGHTDDTPINTPQYPSNWELSAARATAVVRFFLANGLNDSAERLRAVAFGSVAPKAPNRYADGTPIPINQDINRRVTIRVYPNHAVR